MTDTVWIVLIVAAVIVVLALRNRLKSAAVEILGGKASLTAKPASDIDSPGANKNAMLGTNEINLVEGTSASGNTMLGSNKVTVHSSADPAAPKRPTA